MPLGERLEHLWNYPFNLCLLRAGCTAFYMLASIGIKAPIPALVKMNSVK